MSVYGPIERKSVRSGEAIGQFEPVKSTTEDSLNNGLVVVKPTAITSVVIGVAMESVTGADQGLEIAVPGSIVLMRCGAGGVTKDSYVGLDGTDFTEIANLTLSGAGTTNRQVLGIALRTGAANDLVPIQFNPFVATI